MWLDAIKKMLSLASLLILLAACGNLSSGSSQPIGAAPGSQSSQPPVASPSSPPTSQGQNPCNKSSSIKGSIVTISHVSTGNQLGSLLLDGSKEQQTLYPNAVVRVLTATQIFEKQGTVCQAIPFNTLQVGQRVQIQSTGPVLQSEPPQIDATEIVIVA